MDRMLSEAVDYYIHLTEQAGERLAMWHTLLRYDVDRADLIAAAADRQSPAIA